MVHGGFDVPWWLQPIVWLIGFIIDVITWVVGLFTR